ncbi:MAG: hypothetical protein LBE84_06665 [Planctomycetota bacterium]|nr:hypothetical protein [Planctomycetota bacterium]
MTNADPRQDADNSPRPGEVDSLTVRFLRQGKVRAALDRAKSVHKSRPNQNSETLLLQCYAARIRELRTSGHEKDASALEANIAKSFPRWDPALVGAPLPPHPGAAASSAGDVKTAAPGDPLGEALLRLADADAPEEERRAAEMAVAELAFDPLLLVRHPSLTPGHPLETAAKAVAAAFSAVTSRPVDAAAISLPEVSRRSPLAGWKLLIRAIRHMQRCEDAQATAALDSLAAMRSAPARLVPPLRYLLAGYPEKVDGVWKRLFASWRPGERRLPAALERLDSVLAAFLRNSEDEFIPERRGRRLEKNLFAALHAVSDAARPEAPNLVARLRELAVAKAAMVTDIPLPEIEKALGGPAARTASFWRLAALAMREKHQRTENPDQVADLCFCWDAFRRHGAAENLFADGGPEQAEIDLRLAGMLTDCWTDTLRTVGRKARIFDPEYCYGPEQSEAVRKLAPPADKRFVPSDPMFFFARAVEAAPSAGSFRSWLEAARRIETETRWRPGGIDAKHEPSARVLESWSRALPKDPTPWLILLDEAERRNALTLAQKHLFRAEAIDPLNADLTRAKWRLALAMCRRHLKQGKAHLVEADIRKLKALRRHGPENTDWLFAALEWVIPAPLPAMSERLHAELAAMAGGGFAGEYAAGLLETGILDAADSSFYSGKHPMSSPPQPNETAAALPWILRVVRLLAASGFPFSWAGKSTWPAWFAKIAGSLPARDLPLLTESMLAGGHFDALFALSAAGLAEKGKTPETGRLLALRARALHKGKTYQYERIRQCLRAAAEIGRRTNDQALTAEVAALARRNETPLGILYSGNGLLAPMRDDELDEVMKIERGTPRFSKGRNRDPHLRAVYRRVPKFDAFDDSDECQCPECRKARGRRPLPRESNGGDFDPVEMLGGLRNTDLSKCVKIVGGFLFDSGLSQRVAQRLSPLVAPTLLMAVMKGNSIGAGFFDFLRKNPDLREEIMKIVPEFSPDDRRMFEEIDERAADEIKNAPKMRSRGRR